MGMPEKNASNAASPPAEAPMPTMGKLTTGWSWDKPCALAGVLGVFLFKLISDYMASLMLHEWKAALAHSSDR